MILKLPEGEKQWLWRFKCDIFHIFCKFSGNEVETVFRKSKWEPPKWFHFKVCQKFQKSFEATLKSKTNTLSVWKWIFEFLCTFFSEQVENDFGESKAKQRQSIQNCVNPKSDIENVLENGFETTLRSKADELLNFWKKKFSVFCTILSQEVETAYCESKAKCSKVFESKVGHGKHFRK